MKHWKQAPSNPFLYKLNKQKLSTDPNAPFTISTCTNSIVESTAIIRIMILYFIVVVGFISCREEPEDLSSIGKNNNLFTKNEDIIDSSTYTFAKKMMGTLVTITIVDSTKKNAERASNLAFKEMKRIETLLSERIKNSEISRINQAAGEKAVKVSKDTIKVIAAGMEVSKWSHGAFDLSWAVLRDLYSFTPEHYRHPSTGEIKNRLPLIQYRDIVINEEAQTVKLLRKGMKLGVGGIAKGLALDYASDILKKTGIKHFMLFGGGQVQVSGKRSNRAWRVGIRHPRRHDYFAVVEATNNSISTSGDYERAFIDKGRRWHHLLDPRTGLPVDHTTSVTVIAKKGIYADALSTAIFIMGYRNALQILSSAPGTPEFVVVDKDLRIHQSSNIKHRLNLRVELENGKLPL